MMASCLRAWPLYCSVFFLLARGAHANLPDTFHGWQTKSFQPIPPSRVAFFAGEDAPLFAEYGFVAGQRREYAKNNSTLTVTLWQMKDSSGSLGLFTFYQERNMAGVEGEDPVLAAPGHWLMRRGTYVVDARGEGLENEEARLLLGQVPRLPPSQDALPMVPAYLPEENLIPQSGRFLIGPVAFNRLETALPPSAIGFDLGAEAATAQYRMDGGNVRLLLVSYATPQLAAKKLRSFEELPAVSNAEAVRNVFIRRKGSLLCFVFNAPRQATAEKLFDRVRYESVVTWNERVPTPRDNIGNLVLAAFFLTGFLLLIAVVAGVSFGGIRFLAKKFLPWEIFDRPSQVEIIRLHLSDR